MELGGKSKGHTEELEGETGDALDQMHYMHA